MDNQPTRAYCMAQGALPSVTWQPGWEGSLGKNGYMCVGLSCSAVHLKLSQHCCTPIQNKKLKKFITMTATCLNLFSAI